MEKSIGNPDMEMNDATFQVSLLARQLWLKDRIGEYEKEIINIGRLLATRTAFGPKGPKEAVASILQRSPIRDWSPPELRDEIERMAGSGLVKFQGDSLLATHSALRGLVEDGSVVRVGRKKYKAVLVAEEGPCLVQGGAPKAVAGPESTHGQNAP